MRIRSEKGFTGIDIAVSVVLVFLFVGLIVTLSTRISSVSKELELKVNATYMAVDEIEKVKGWDFNELIDVGEETEEITFDEGTEDKVTITVNNSEPGTPIDDTGFYKRILIKDYSDIDPTKIPNIVKKVTVVISYQFKGKTEEVKLSILLAREI